MKALIRSMQAARIRRRIASCLGATLVWSAPAVAQSVSRRVAPGITFEQRTVRSPVPLTVNVLRVNLKAPGVQVRVGQSGDAISADGATRGRETVSSQVIRSGAAAGVNGDFFPFTSSPVGLEVRDGAVMTMPLGYRVCLGLTHESASMDVVAAVMFVMTASGQRIPIDGVNRSPGSSDTVLLTSAYQEKPLTVAPAVVVSLEDMRLPLRIQAGQAAAVRSVDQEPSGAALPACPIDQVRLVASGPAADSLALLLRKGDRVGLTLELVSNGPPPTRGRYPARAGGRDLASIWTGVSNAVSGGPWLVRNGSIALDPEAEWFGDTGFVTRRHARTAAGIAADGTLLLVTVDDVQPGSHGATLAELADLMKNLGAVNAMNLDGGGSTTMVVRDAVVNAPSGGDERPVANAVLVFAGPASPPVTDLLHVASPDGGPLSTRAGEELELTLRDASGRVEQQAIWGTADGRGYVSQAGAFRSERAGAHAIVAVAGGDRFMAVVTVQPGLPAALTARLAPVANDPPDRNQLTVHVRDTYGNPVPNIPVSGSVQTGELEEPLVTDAQGTATAEIVWDSPAGQRKVVLTAADLRCVAKPQ